MPNDLTRRRFLQSAGGVTFLALTGIGRGVFAATNASPLRPAPPLFTALPYIQPGNNSRLIAGQESVVLAWQTEAKSADFVVTYGPTSRRGSRAHLERGLLVSSEEKTSRNRFCYSAHLAGLELGTRYYYRVMCNEAVVMEGYFTTRQPRGHRVRFVAFGDNSFGDIADRATAFRAYQQHPDFVMNTGDNVYDSGLNNEYERFFFPVYNADAAEIRTGAPLLRTVPFYTVIANHDVRGKSANGIFADFDADSDSLAYYTAMHLPLNGPVPNNPTPIGGAAERLSIFRNLAGSRFPRMANYSFDYGDAHFTCLDSNIYIDPTDTTLQEWIRNDLSSTDAHWKFVVFHHPGFNAGAEHYSQQHMRALSPLFEQMDVDVVLHGHEHTYQRPRPLKFAPSDLAGARKVQSKERYTPGQFDLDERFDGEKNTRAEGILYLVTGAGGKNLYDAGWTQNPAKWRHEQDGNLDYVTKFISDRHSLTVFDLHGDLLHMAQIDVFGQEIDRITLSKT